MPLIVDRLDGLAIVQLSNPGRMNAIDLVLRREIAHLFEQLQDDAEVRVIILAGEGENFCSGADIREAASPALSTGIARIRLLHRMIRSVKTVYKPVIAAVEGVCAGVGWSLALAADFIVAAEDARFQFAFCKIGLAPDGAASFLLTQHVGMMRAKELLYSGRVVSGVESQALGLALKATAKGQALAAARDLASTLLAGPPLAIALAKRQLGAARGQQLDEALDLEAAMQPLLLQSADYTEGVAAFRERRGAVFRGE